MFGKVPVIALMFVAASSGCTQTAPRLREEAKSAINGVSKQEAEREFPDDYRSALHALETGENLLKEHEAEEAENYFRLAWTKGKLLEQDIADLRLRREEEARVRVEVEQQEHKNIPDVKDMQALARGDDDARKVDEKAWQSRARHPSVSHTVKRGETLPKIAAQPHVYNDNSLWPLLYRANRDQISDPKHIWAGQVLRIPRNVTRDELAEAHRYAHEKPID